MTHAISDSYIIPAIITRPKLKFALCQSSIATIQSTRKHSTKLYPKIEGEPSSLKCGQINLGYKVVVDQFECRVRFQTWYFCGNTIALTIFLGGTIFYYYVSLVVMVKPQFSLNGANTIQYTHCFYCQSNYIGIEIQGYNGDNGIFTSHGFDDFHSYKNKSFTLCGIG